MTHRKRVEAAFLALLMVVSVITVGAGSVAAQQSPTEDPARSALDNIDPTQGSLDAGTNADVSTLTATNTAEKQEVEISDGLRDRNGETVLLLSVERNLDRESIGFAGVDENALRSDSKATLSPVIEQLRTFEHAEVRKRFWVGNVISVSADLDEHDVEEFAAIDGVTSVSPNAEAHHPAPADTEPTVSTEDNDGHTYGLEQIDVPGFEEEFGDRGGNATVAIIDDGISNPEAGHPDLEFAQEAVAVEGEVETGTLGDPGSHGEHVAGTVAGAANPAGDVPRYGVAPNASLIMINAFQGQAAAEDILASIQYSAEQDADVATMSLGFSSSTGNSVLMNAMESTIQDANGAGTLVIGSAGNAGAGDAGGPATSPGAEFSGFSIGASNEAGGIATFSSGAVVSPHAVEYVDSGTYPEHYPRTYVKPDVAAPGADILSAGPVGTAVDDDAATYSISSGTSMAAPHVAGAAALVQSATEADLDPKLIESALEETAEKPDNEFAERHGRDIRYGTGIINVTAATQAVMAGTMEIDGTVTGTDGEPITGASVTTDGGALTSTNATGSYTLQTTGESVAVTADAFGYEASTQTVDADDEPVDFELADELAVDLLDDQAAYAEFGGEVGVTADVRNLGNVTVRLTEETNISEDDLTLLLDGDEIAFNETQSLDDYDGQATITVDIAEDADVEEGSLIGLEHTFAGLGETVSVSTGPTTMTEELEPAFFELDNLDAPNEHEIGNALPSTVEVTNTGQVTATKYIQTFVNGDAGEATLTPEQLTIEPGETTTYEVAATGIGGIYSAGEVIDIGYRTADDQGLLGGLTGINDETSTEVALQAPGTQFTVESLDAPTEVSAGEDVEVTATIENVGSESGEQDVEFRFDGEAVASKPVALDAFGQNASGNSEEVTFSVTMPEESGIYTHGVFTENDSATASLGVDTSIPSVTVVSTNEYGSQTVDLLQRGLTLNGQAAAVSYEDASAVDEGVISNTDVFVFHDVGDAASDLIPTVEDSPTTSAVYLEQFSDSNAIADRSDVTNDPESSLTAWGDGTPVEFEIVEDHSLFEGVGAEGDRIPVHTFADADRAYFQGADGDTLAEVGVAGQANDGSVAAVDPESGSVLLGTIAPNSYEAESAFTDSAAQILANSITVAQDGIVSDAVGSTSIDAEFIGTVDDDEMVTVSASDAVVDGEPVDGEEITFTVGDEPVATATIENGAAEASFDPATIDADAGETLTVGVEEYVVLDSGEVETVHETMDLQDGYNLLSVPQAADLSTEDVGAINTWNTTGATYETVTQSAFDSASDLSNGLYVSATSDDARVGFTFSDDVPVGGTDDLETGWTLAGSNFAIDSPEGDTRTLDEDLLEVDPSELTVFSSGFDQQYDGSSTIGSYDAYWAFNGESSSEERAIVSPAYATEDREDTLGVEESNFTVTEIDASVLSTAEYEVGADDVLSSDEDVVEVEVTVTNDGGLDTQFVDLHADAAQNGSFTLADRSLGLTLGEGETKTVTLVYAPTQDDPPAVDLRATTEDSSAEADVGLGTGGLTVEDQALTLDDEFVVSGVDFAGDATIEVVDDGETIGSTTVEGGDASDVLIPLANTTTGAVEVRLLNADGEEQSNTTATIAGTTIEVANEAPSNAFADEESVDVPVEVTNNALVGQTVDVAFAVDGSSADSATVSVSGGSTEAAVTFTDDVSGHDAGDEVEYTVSAAGSSDTATLQITEAALTFSDQASDAGEVLIEDVTASAGQTVVLTDTDLTIVDTHNVSEDMVDGTVSLSAGESAPGEYIAHVVADTDDVADEAGFVNDGATVYGADVVIDDVTENVDEEQLPYSVDEVTVDVADLTDAETDGTNFTVEIREGGEVIGESGTLNGSNSEVTVGLDDPITAETAGTTARVDAVLVDESGEAFQIAETGEFEGVSDSATVTINAGEASASVALPDQEIGAANGSDAVLVEDVTGQEGQFVVITDSDLHVVGTHALDERAVGDELVVELDDGVEPGEYRAHLTSDVSLVGEDGIVSDSGTLLDAELGFADQEFVGSTSEVAVETADLLDGTDDGTEFTVAIHGESGDVIGTATGLTGENSDVPVSLDEPIDEEGDYVAKLQFGAEEPVPVVDDGAVSTISDGATITPIDSAAAFDDQILGSGDEVLIEDVQAAENSTIVLTYGDNDTVAGIGPADFASEEPDNVSITVDDTDGFPGEHTAHVIPTDQLSGEYAPGDNVSAADAANATTSVSATVYDASLTIEDQTVEDSTDEVVVATAALLDGASDDTTFGVELTADGEVVGTETGLSGEETDVTVSLSESIDATTGVTATLVTDDGAIPQAGDSAFTTLTDSATVTVETAEGGNVDFADQAVGADGEVVVENVQPVESNEVTTEAGVEPGSDFLVLTDADGNIVDSVQFSGIDGGEDVELNASGASPGAYTVAIHESNAAGDAPDPDAPRGVTATATVYEGDLTLDDQQYEEQADSVELSTAALLDGTADGATFTVNVTSGEAVIGSETFSGKNTDVTVDLDEPISSEASISAELLVDGETVQQASDTTFEDLTDDATVSIVASNFEVSSLDVGGQGADAAVEPGADPVDINVSVQNTGDISAAQDIVLNITDDGQSVAERTQSLSISPSFTGPVTFADVAVGDLEPGEYDVSVASDDDAATGTLAVEEPANFQVTINNGDSDLDVVGGEDAVVNATIENTGDQQAEQTVNFTVDGTNAGSQAVTLDGGASQTVEFSYETNSGDDGATASVSTDDGSDSRELTVDEPAAYEITIGSFDSSVTEGGEISVEYTVTNTGDVEGKPTVTFTVNDSLEGETTHILDGGASSSSVVTYATEAGDSPTVTIDLEIDGENGDTATETVTVNAAETG